MTNISDEREVRKAERREKDRRLKELNEFWTKHYSKMANDMIRSSAFAEMNGKILDGNLEFKQLNDSLANRYLKAMGWHTKETIDDIYFKLHDMDRKLSDIYRTVNSDNGKGKK